MREGFANTESKEHGEAKLKLYDLLLNNKVKIKDHLGNVYSILEGNRDEEFLKIENPSIWGYIPDITYGYKGKEELWLEILHLHECKWSKVNACKVIGAKIIEFNSMDILNFTEEKEFVVGMLVTSMDKDEYYYNTKIIKRVNKYPDAKRRKKVMPFVKKEKMKDYLQNNFDWFVDKMRENIINKKYFLKDKIDDYIKKQIGDTCVVDDFEKTINHFYRKNGFGVITASTYNKELLLSEGIDFFDQVKIIIPMEVSRKLSENYNLRRTNQNER